MPNCGVVTRGCGYAHARSQPFTGMVYDRFCSCCHINPVRGTSRHHMPSPFTKKTLWKRDMRLIVYFIIFVAVILGFAVVIVYDDGCDSVYQTGQNIPTKCVGRRD